MLLKASSTPPRYLAVCWASLAFSYRNLDSFSTPGGSIELMFLYLMIYSSTPPQYLYLSNTFFLNTFLDRWLDTSLNLICQDLLKHYLFFLVRSKPHFFQSLSLDSSLFSLPNNLISLQSWSSRFLQAFSSFSSLGKLLISHSSCISCFET